MIWFFPYIRWRIELLINYPPPPENFRRFVNDIFKMHFHKWKQKYVPNGEINNKSVLVQVMTWRRSGGKALPEPMQTQFTVVCMRHYWEVS